MMERENIIVDFDKGGLKHKFVDVFAKTGDWFIENKTNGIVEFHLCLGKLDTDPVFYLTSGETKKVDCSPFSLVGKINCTVRNVLSTSQQLAAKDAVTSAVVAEKVTPAV